MCDTCECQTHHHHNKQEKQIIDINKSLLAANTEQAVANRKTFESLGAVAINLISSPGSGKTTLLEHTIDRLGNELRIGVIEGDIETDRDAARIRAKGVPVVQITTGGACHLDARLVHRGLHQLTAEHKGNFDLLFIENVGNLVCPATFDLGEHQRIVLLSVPEGSDKPAKYPKPFQSSDGFLITKTDLLPYFDFSLEESHKEAHKLNPDLFILQISAPTGDGFDAWLDYLRSLCKK
jgi:hydrogenase nickel incorporation protein HypB